MYRSSKNCYGTGSSLSGSLSGPVRSKVRDEDDEEDPLTLERNLCLYGGHLCRREKHGNFDYCLRHILEDKSAPYKQCTYNIKSQKRCPKPAPKHDKTNSSQGYCKDHARRSFINRQKAIGRKRPHDNAIKWVQHLAHYKVPKIENTSSSPSKPSTKTEDDHALKVSSPVKSSEASEEGPVEVKEDNKSTPKSPEKEEDDKKSCRVEKTPQVDPFQILSVSVCNPRNNDGSDIESEDEEMVLNSWTCDGDSDAESIDSDMENPLKYAGGYAAEEVVRIMRDKLIRLQKSYIDQFQRLQYILKEERRNYKHRLRREKESMMSIHQQPKPTPEEKGAYSMIKSLNHYNKARGKEAVFAASVKEKRLKVTEGSNYKPSRPLPKCTYHITSNLKCGETVIPLTKYCIKHIMEDTNQILFRHCGVITEADDGPCENPIVDTFDGNTCVYHTPIAPLYSQVTDDQLLLDSSNTASTKTEPTSSSTTLNLLNDHSTDKN